MNCHISDLFICTIFIRWVEEDEAGRKNMFQNFMINFKAMINEKISITTIENKRPLLSYNFPIIVKSIEIKDLHELSFQKNDSYYNLPDLRK